MQNIIKKEPLGGGFSIFVSNVHRFGTDAILLSHFASLKKKDIACDLGKGCGIIPLIWCKNQYPARVVGVEIQSEATNLVNLSITENSLEGRFEIITADLRKLKGILPRGHFSVVTINPPYKSVLDGVISPNNQNAIARHEIECTLDDCCSAAAGLLNFSGRFCMCHRPSRLCDIFLKMRESGIEPKRVRLVFQRAGCSPSLVLVEGKKGASPHLIFEPPLYIEDENGEFTNEMALIYGDYKFK